MTYNHRIPPHLLSPFRPRRRQDAQHVEHHDLDVAHRQADFLQDSSEEEHV